MVYDAITDFLCGILSDMIGAFGSYVCSIFDDIYAIDSALGITVITTYLRNIAGVLIVAFTIKIAFDTYIFQTTGDPDSDPLDLVTRACETIAIVYSSDFICTQIITAATTTAGEIMGKDIFLAGKEFSSKLEEFDAAAQACADFVFVIVGLAVGIVVCLIIFSLKAAKRGAELEMARIIMPVLALDLLTTDRERWRNFFWDYVATAFGYILTLMSMNLAFIAIVGFIKDQSMVYMLACLGWLLFCISAPKWLKKYLYSSGVGQMARGAAQSAVTIRMMSKF